MYCRKIGRWKKSTLSFCSAAKDLLRWNMFVCGYIKTSILTTSPKYHFNQYENFRKYWSIAAPLEYFAAHSLGTSAVYIFIKMCFFEPGNVLYLYGNINYIVERKSYCTRAGAKCTHLTIKAVPNGLMSS